MELIFLGTGTSQGVPMIAQPEKGAPDLSDPRNWRTRTSVHVVMNGHHIQVDAAPEFRLQCIHNHIGRVDTFILTHAHADHILGMDDLRRFIDLRGGEALPVYSSDEGLERICTIFPYAIRDRPAVTGYPAFALHPMPKVLEIEGVGRIHSCLLPHGPIEVLGLVFEEFSSGCKIAYFTDCKEVTPQAKELAKGADVVVLDALRPQPHPSHMSLAEAMETALQMNAAQTYFTHMTYMVDHVRASAELPSGIAFAYDGLRVVF